MTVLVTGSQVRGLPVVTVSDGEDVAEVRDIVYSPEAGRLLGLTLNKRGFLAARHGSVLPIGQVHAIGRDAVMITDESKLQDAEGVASEMASPGAAHDVIGADVLTEGGVSLGSVTDLVLVAGGTGEVLGYEIDRPGGRRAYVPLPAQLAVSGAALVVPDETPDLVQEDPADLPAAVRDLRARLGPR